MFLFLWLMFWWLMGDFVPLVPWNGYTTGLVAAIVLTLVFRD